MKILIASAVTVSRDPERGCFLQELDCGFSRQLLPDRGLMIGDGFPVQPERIGDLLDSLTLDEKAEHVALTLGQPVIGRGPVAERQFLSNVGT
jgi:hypothetical protein